MKLLNYTSAYFAVILLVLISIWGAIFYYAMLDEIYDSIDDGLDNQKGLIIQKIGQDTSVLSKTEFGESDYAIRELQRNEALNFHDTYEDTMMYMQNENSDEPVRLLKTVFLHDGRYYELKVATSMVEEDDLIKQLLYSILWLYFGLVISISLFNNFLLKRIWKPFYNLLRQLKSFRLDKPEPIVSPPTNVAEFKILNETVHKLLQRNIDTYNSQKSFIENASHELQTPLAITINKLERLAETNELSAENLGILSSAMDNLVRLSRMNKSLLLLSKIENRQFVGETPVNINEMVNMVVEEFADQAAFSEITVQLIPGEPCIINMNADLASILVTNLVKNAIIHNVRNGTIEIIINNNSLIITNIGQDKPLDETKIYGRFHTGKPSQNTTGLGLAIVKTITTVYGFRIEYLFNGRHQVAIHF